MAPKAEVSYKKCLKNYVHNLHLAVELISKWLELKRTEKVFVFQPPLKFEYFYCSQR